MPTATITTFDWEMIAALVAVICAVTSPLFTALINNHHANKMFYKTVLRDHGIKEIENYFSYASMALLNGEANGLYLEAYTKVFLYTPKKAHGEIKDLHKVIMSLTPTTAYNELVCYDKLSHIAELIGYVQ